MIELTYQEQAMEIYLDWIKQKQIEEAQMHSTEIPRQIWGQMETSSPKESAQDPSLPEFDPLSFLWSHSTKAAELTAESGVQPQDTLFCCNKIQFMEKVGSWKAEAAVQGFLEYFMEHASSIRLGESPPTDYISPERLVVVMDSKGKKAHWFYLKEYVEDNLKIKSWEEFERAKSEPEWLYNKITTQMAETYTGTNVDKKPLFCPIHGESRWVISIAEKDVQVEQQNTTELLLTQPVSLPPFEVSSICPSKLLITYEQ